MNSRMLFKTYCIIFQPVDKSSNSVSKKERRAAKVQQKQLNAQNAEKTNLSKGPSVVKPDVKPKAEDVNVDVNRKKDQISEVKNSNTLSKAEEKELRRKEWEAKLGKQKEGKPEKDDVKENKESVNKAELRAKRREVQEAQRLAKAVTLNLPEKKPEPKAVKVEVKKMATKNDVKKPHSASKVQLVHHLYTEDSMKYDYENFTVNIKGVHPAFMTIGAQYASNTVLGSNARCLALLSALKSLVEDLSTPPKQEFCRHLESVLQFCVAYLQHCRPIAVSMTNALKHFKFHLTQVETSLADNVKKSKLLDVIDTYIQNEIQKADEAICMNVTEKIYNGVILTYGCSSLIRKILIDAHNRKKKFEVIIVDGRPLLEGREMLKRIVEAGITCKYVPITSVSRVMKLATTVLLGAHALLANGYVMSRMATAQVASIARAFNKPVLVCCETYKFSEKVQMDSFVYNEIGNPDKMLTVETLEEPSPLANWKTNINLTPLNLLYDVTPRNLVTCIVTELGILPCTSAPVVLRIRPNELS